MPDGRVCYIDDVVQLAGNDEQNVVADDWRRLKLEHSLPDTVALCCGDIGGLVLKESQVD